MKCILSLSFLKKILTLTEFCISELPNNRIRWIDVIRIEDDFSQHFPDVKLVADLVVSQQDSRQLPNQFGIQSLQLKNSYFEFFFVSKILLCQSQSWHIEKICLSEVFWNLKVNKDTNLVTDFDDESEKVDFLSCKPVRTGSLEADVDDLLQKLDHGLALQERHDLRRFQTSVRPGNVKNWLTSFISVEHLNIIILKTRSETTLI